MTRPAPGSGGTRLAAFMWAEGRIESGGNYHAVNPGSGALGYWQVMPANIPGWSREMLGHAITGNEFLNSPHDQDVICWGILGGYFDEFGPRGAAAMWYSGQPNPNLTYGNPPVYRYVDNVIAVMAQYGGQSASGGGSGPGPGIAASPAPDFTGVRDGWQHVRDMMGVHGRKQYGNYLDTKRKAMELRRL